ncbi:hypothetical protein [Vandammella animalimorsus]|uniref:DUF3102 domain-containing protein n=1 Tax=Vandammella animalimorsus TaxID=2029117 RepID=A0A2A2A782_9BURK|nr:hypothetical protein [Vandammella animalimorsus]PAT32893.1 hypothetical protein CK620_13550 [Vandammella animalimorsus]
MARKPTGTSAPTELIEVAPEYTDATERAQDALALQEQQVLANVQTAAKQLGYEGALSVGALEDGIRFYQRRSVEALLECGKRLLLLKEMTPHGEFQRRVEMLGFSDRTARRFMQAAVKVSKSATVAVLAGQVKSAKAFLELVTHDDDADIERVAEMDDVDRMSASQLREALRQERQDNKYQAELTDKERKRAEQLEKQLRKGGPQVQPYSERLAEFRTGVGELQDVAGKSLVQMAKQIDALAQWWQQEVLAAPDYDPQAPVRMPPELLDTARALAEHIELLAGGVGALQHKVAQAFGAELEMQPQYLMRDPMGGQMGDAEQDGDGVDEGEAAYADASA